MTTGIDRMLVALPIKRQMDKNLAAIDAKLDAIVVWKRFPPEGTEFESWYVMMGIDQVQTLSLPASKLRDVGFAIDLCDWGPFDTELHPTYDFQLV